MNVALVERVGTVTVAGGVARECALRTVTVMGADAGQTT